MPAALRLDVFTSAFVRRFLLGLIVLLFAVTNLPWTLDDYDQAKQAYTSFEMVRQGHWLFQHTPNEGVATKPPLVGWISAGIFAVTRSWEAAWRLPSFLAALALLGLIARESRVRLGGEAALLATCAFGLNLLSARLATLVRTDMPLALGTFVAGLIIWRKVERAEEWTTRDRWFLCAALAATLLIKGPIVYAFLLPGLIVYALVRRKRGGARAWSGWWPWLLSLAIFLAWALAGILRQPGFYESVVLKEFAGRFSETVHKPQPLLFYFPHLLQKFAPWSLLLVGLAILLRKRRLPLSPATLWLVCWSLGGLFFLSLIPSKRVDRIFPVVPPLCLLLGAQVAAVRKSDGLEAKVRPWLRGALLFAVLFTGGYSAWKIGLSLREEKDALVRFATTVRRTAEEKHWRYAVSGGHEEGLLLYLRQDHFLRPNDAVRRWKKGELDALVVPADDSADWAAWLAAPPPALLSAPSGFVSRYALFLRAPSP